MFEFKSEIAKIIGKVITEVEKKEIENMIEVPQEKAMGDYAFPCFRLAKIMRKAPNLIAQEISKQIEGEEIFDKVEPVNAYVNMFVSKSKMSEETIGEILRAGDKYGETGIGCGKKIIVEYSSPNIAKPFHIGHIRSTVIGNSIANIYEKMGYDVVRINHLGDYGTQFGKIICAYRHWGNKEDVEKAPIKTLLGYYTRFHEESEENPALIDEARTIFVKLEQGNKEEVELWKWFREESLKEFTEVYDMLGIKFDSYKGESFYSDKMDRFVEELEEKHLLKQSQGASVVDLEEYNLGTALIKKSDGSTLYITRDIAAAVYRKETYDFYKNIYVVASQQNLHFQQWIKIIELLGYDWAKSCVHVPFGMVSLEDGTMSTRKGRVVFLKDVLTKAVEKTESIIKEKNSELENIEKVASQVGIGAVVFQELSANRIKDYVFSWDKVLNFDGETGPYVQYTHARCASLIRRANVKEEEIISGHQLNLGMLSSSDTAFELIKLLYAFPDVIESACEKYEPSIITRHLIDIARAFNKFYHDEHILVEDENERKSKLALVMSTKTVIKTALKLLGIEAPEKM